jgi:hypothetical protein
MRLPVMLFLLVFLAVAQQSQPPSPAPGKTANADQKKSKPKQQQASPDEEATKSLTTAILQLRAEIAARNQQQSTTPDKDEASAKWWSVGNAVLITIFTGILAWVAVLQWKAMHRQADIYDRQAKIADKQADIAAEQLAITKANEARREIERTKEEDARYIRAQIEDKKYLQQVTIANDTAMAARRSADAASLNAQAIINSERPWVVVRQWHGPDALISTVDILASGQSGRYVVFIYEFENRGRTPARITDGKMYFTISEKLPDEPYFGDVSEETRPDEIPVDGRFMPPATEDDPPLILRQIYRGPRSFMLTEEERSRIRSGELTYCCYACIWYTDMFKRQHETRVCYVWHTPDNTDSFEGFRLGGPDAYNRHT